MNPYSRGGVSSLGEKSAVKWWKWTAGGAIEKDAVGGENSGRDRAGAASEMA